MRRAAGLQRAKPLQVPRGQAAGGLAVQAAQALDGVRTVSAEGGQGARGPV